METKTSFVVGLVFAVILAAIIGIAIWSGNQPSKYERAAQQAREAQKYYEEQLEESQHLLDIIDSHLR